ncbi:unnamed protein product [Lactuca virosa]|uniref:Uncharacterized protein n=1 Tax=Lactuca virosa TaxID=75947 RepID=A0AAU9P2D5_9ASTR|nr:unnamed protein product [Lactuca virosa]
MVPKEDGQTSKAKSSHKASKSQATGPSTVAGTSLYRLTMAASNYIALLKTQEQPKEVGVIVEYLQKFPLAYALTATSPTPRVDYVSILWEDFLPFLPASKNKFLIHHPRWWSIIIHDVINNSNLKLEELLEGPLPLFLHMSPYRICTASESEFSHPFIIPDVILAKLGENSASLRSYQKYIKGTTSSPKRKRKHSDHASKKSAKKKKKQSKSDKPPSIPSPDVSEDNLGVDLVEPTSTPKSGTTSKRLPFLDSLFQSPSDYVESSSQAPVSPAYFQSDLEGESNHVSLVNYDSDEDDEQEGDKQFELEDLTKSSPVEDNQD